jgi:DNA-binding FrmR family transcriptional regulator
MPSTPEEKKVLTRVRRIRGQIDALERALESGAECRSVLQQIAAVRGAANGLMAEVLESHIRKPLTRMTATVMKSVNQLTIRLSWFVPILNR